MKVTRSTSRRRAVNCPFQALGISSQAKDLVDEDLWWLVKYKLQPGPWVGVSREGDSIKTEIELDSHKNSPI